MMIDKLDRGVFIYHSSMTEPFGELALHLQDCCGGCPYCVGLCAKVVEQAYDGAIGEKLRSEGKWSRYMREEGYREYEQCSCVHAAPYCNDCPVCTRNHQRAILARVERESSTHVDISRGWLRDFMRWLHRRYIQHVPD